MQREGLHFGVQCYGKINFAGFKLFIKNHIAKNQPVCYNQSGSEHSEPDHT